MDNNNIKLNLPFDESNGSKVAYDYSANRADGVVDGATFVPGKNGNAISFHDSGTCEVAKTFLETSMENGRFQHLRRDCLSRPVHLNRWFGC